jgi:23S rRNA (cytidine1920-2'-O)/16S rRNA (cytidine1409-2'-O)-methyltransferase
MRAGVFGLIVSCALALPGVRVDTLLVSRGLCSSRAAAKTAIGRGLVTTRSGKAVKKASVTISEETELIVDGAVESIEGPYVSRGGEKLRAALFTFGVDLSGSVVLDVGASTGGFTDCVLQAGASMVVGVDCVR